MGPLIISKAVQGPMGSRGRFMGPKEVKGALPGRLMGSRGMSGGSHGVIGLF